MLPDDSEEALLRFAREAKGLAGYRPRRRTWRDIDATLKDALKRGYVVLPEMPPQARGIVVETWRQWCVRHDHPVAFVWPHGRRSTLRVSLPTQRVLPDAQVLELTALAAVTPVGRHVPTIVSAHHVVVTVWTREAEAFAAMLRDYVLEHMVPAPQHTPPVPTANRSQ